MIIEKYTPNLMHGYNNPSNDNSPILHAYEHAFMHIDFALNCMTQVKEQEWFDIVEYSREKFGEIFS